jgi:hypothetical protein
MGDEVVGIGAAEHKYLARAVCLSTLNQGDEITDELGPEKVHRRCCDLGEENGPVDVPRERLERP